MEELGARWTEALSDGSREVIMLLDAGGGPHFVSKNGAARRLVGYDGPELLAQKDLTLIHPEDRERVVEAFRHLMAEAGARTTLEFRVKHADGRYVRVQSSATNRLADDAVAA